MTLREFRLPDPGEGLVEAEIVTWRVAVGDTVAVNDIVVEIETSKSLVELPSPYAGTVKALLANEGEMAEVGSPIIAIEDQGSGPVAPSTPPDDLVPSLPGDPDDPEASDDESVDAGKIGGAAPGGRVAMLVGYGPRTTEAKRRPRKGQSDPAGGPAHDQLAHTFSTEEPVSRRTGDRTALTPHQSEPVGDPLPSPGEATAAPLPPQNAPLAKPPVRKLAKDLGVDLDAVRGSGHGGVITRDDVERAADVEAHTDQPSADDQPPRPEQGRRAAEGPETRTPIKGVRKMTASAMVASAFTAPHVTEWLTCDVTASMELLERLRARREFAEVRISPLLLVAKAVLIALRNSPELNSSWDEAAQEIVTKHLVNLGIAAATPRGLLVPNIKDASSRSLLNLAVAINHLVAVAREGKTQPADTANGTFTITNVGVFGIDAGTPILNPGEAGILCLGAIERRPWVVGAGAEERIEPRWLTTVALSFDHRLVDGEQGSRFLAELAGILRDPGLALLTSSG